jgi:hypothetical protein
VDGFAPMGSVSVSTALRRTVRIIATGLPAGGTVEIVRGLVDTAGSGQPDPRNYVTTLPVSEFAGGYVDRDVHTDESRYLRVVVKDATGLVVALSNPVWLLRSVPATGIPPARRY